MADVYFIFPRPNSAYTPARSIAAIGAYENLCLWRTDVNNLACIRLDALACKADGTLGVACTRRCAGSLNVYLARNRIWRRVAGTTDGTVLTRVTRNACFVDRAYGDDVAFIKGQTSWRTIL